MKFCAIAAAATLLGLSCSPTEAQTFKTSAGSVTIETVAKGLVNPWALAFLPDGRMLVTERPGRLRIVDRDGKLSTPLAGLPKVYASSQGGLLDVALDRNFAQNQTIYFCFAEPHDGGGRTSLGRMTLPREGANLTLSQEGADVIFRQQGPVSRGRHFGCRIVQTPDGNLFLTTGDHGSYPKEAQNLGNHIGKIVRIAPDGSVPKDNPFAGRSGALPEIWSYGHRNVQGAALHPVTGKLWANEHGPRGGDELNVVEKGKNYGWPVIGFGIDYSGAKIHEATSRPGMEQPIKHWTPVIAASGMAFYQGDLFPAWKGNALIGGLATQVLVRLTLDGERVTGEEYLLDGLRERIRDVRVGPDGAIYLVTDSSDGRILRLTPAK